MSLIQIDNSSIWDHVHLQLKPDLPHEFQYWKIVPENAPQNKKNLIYDSPPIYFVIWELVIGFPVWGIDTIQ